MRTNYLSRTLTTGLAALTFCLLAVEAQAAGEVPSLDLRGFQPPTDPNGGLSFESAGSPSTGAYNAGLYTSYGFRQVGLSPTGGAPIRVLEHQLSSDFIANIGLFDRLAIGIDLPFVLFQAGDDPAADLNQFALRTLGSYALPRYALGDVKVVVKGTLIRPTLSDATSPNAGFSLAILQRLGIPTGDQQSYLGEGAVTSETRLLGSYDLFALAVHGSLGVKVRAERENFACPGLVTDEAIFACPRRFGHELPFNLAIAVKPQAFGLDKEGRWQWFAELYGHVPVYPLAPFSSGSALLSQAQVGAGARYTFDNDLSLLAGVDFATVAGLGNAPVRGTLAIGWAPRKHDIDNDGVLDRDDQCPEFAEDRDGFEDTDGCPDIDNDEDSVKDAVDRCPNVPEDADGFEDGDGCPEADNDQDGILDVADHCPNVPGVAAVDPIERGCPDLDPDKDGVKGTADQCPMTPEDRDGFQDEDGCPDPDNDGDGIQDADDRCSLVAGIATADDARTNGCPDTDSDGIVDTKDACPSERGVTDPESGKNGCPQPVAPPAVAPPGMSNDSTKPGAVKPGAAKPGAAKPEAAKPGAAKPEVAKPAVAKPAVAKPAVAKPAPAKSP